MSGWVKNIARHRKVIAELERDSHGSLEAKRLLTGRPSPRGTLDNYVVANRLSMPTTLVMNVSPLPWPASPRT
jgi:hypothetical protein